MLRLMTIANGTEAPLRRRALAQDRQHPRDNPVDRAVEPKCATSGSHAEGSGSAGWHGRRRQVATRSGAGARSRELSADYATTGASNVSPEDQAASRSSNNRLTASSLLIFVVI
jgi:hypothetical protein